MRHKLLFMLTATAIMLSVVNLPVGLRAESAVPVDLEVPSPPFPVNADGKVHLFYELHFSNFRAGALELKRVEILADGGQSQLFASYEGDELEKRLARPGAAPDIAEKRIIGGGLRAVIFLDLVVDAHLPIPRRLRHRLAFKSSNSESVGEDLVEGGNTLVSRTVPILLGPPLRGGGWLAANGPSNDSEHRRSLIAVGGKARISQRFAIDWLKLGPDGQVASGSPARNSNWYGYEIEVLAVADSKVVDIKDGIPENDPLTDKFAVPITLETIAGNYLMLDLGHSRYALYAHLKPGSIRVRNGDAVRRGQVLGLIGNTGNSDAPHLHFQISDTNSPLGGEGVPYVFDSFEVLGKVDSLDELIGGKRWKPQPATEIRKREVPVENAVVQFPR